MYEIAPDQEPVARHGRSVDQLDRETAQRVRRILIELASDQDEAAAREAAQVPYWKTCPDSVRGSRAAARALRAAAESLV